MSVGLFADLVMVKGKVVTVDGKSTVAQAVAVRDGRIVRIGTTKEIMKLKGKDTRIIDLKGRTVLPGLTDAHVHMISSAARALDTRWLDCRDLYHPEIKSLEDILERIEKYAQKQPKGSWIRVQGSPMQPFRLKERRFPNKHDLDKAAPEHPAFIYFGAHVTVANTMALKMANITRHTQNPIGGWIEKDASGEPTGILREKAQPFLTNLLYPGGREVTEDHLKKNIPIPQVSDYTYQDMKRGVEGVVQKCLERGCTTVHDVVASPEEIRAYHETLKEGKLKMRIVLLPRVYESQIKADTFLNLGALTGFGNHWLKIGGMKMSIDGGITGCNAAFYEPYLHEPDNRGVIRIPQEVLNGLISKLNKAGLQCAVHAIGDRAFDMILEAYEKALAEFPRKDHRHRIEHGPGNWLCTPERLQRMKKMGIVPVPNIGLNLYYLGDTMIEVLGARRMAKMCPFKMLLKAGLRLTNGTDAPGYIPVDPLREIWACVVRRSLQGKKIATEESISVMDAIRIHTINAAHAEFSEEAKGSIELGKLADLVVLAEDPLTIKPEKIKDIKVDYTIVDGRIVYQRTKR